MRLNLDTKHEGNLSVEDHGVGICFYTGLNADPGVHLLFTYDEAERILIALDLMLSERV